MLPAVRVLVAGASGLIGKEIVLALKQRGHWVRTLSRDPERAKALAGQADEVVVADATEPGALRGPSQDVEVVISALGAAVSPSARGSRSFAEVDAAANLALLEEAKRAGVRRFVYVGVYTSERYASTAYVAAHTQVEMAIKGSGLEYGFVRPTGVFGAFVELLEMAKKGPLPAIGGGAALTNPVHEADVAAAVVDAAIGPGNVEVDIGGPDELSRRAIAELAFRALGRRPRILAMPAWLMGAVAAVYGLFNRRVGEFLRFIILASTHSCVAPKLGKHRLEAYFAERA